MTLLLLLLLSLSLLLLLLFFFFYLCCYLEHLGEALLSAVRGAEGFFFLFSESFMFSVFVWRLKGLAFQLRCDLRQVMMAFQEASSGRKAVAKPKKRENRRRAIIESLHTCLKQWLGALLALFWCPLKAPFELRL